MWYSQKNNSFHWNNHRYFYNATHIFNYTPIHTFFITLLDSFCLLSFITATKNPGSMPHADAYLINTWSKDMFKYIIKFSSFCWLFNNTQSCSSHGTAINWLPVTNNNRYLKMDKQTSDSTVKQMQYMITSKFNSQQAWVNGTNINLYKMCAFLLHSLPANNFKFFQSLKICHWHTYS